MHSSYHFFCRYLTERLARTKEEKDLANQMGRRYKEALEKSKRINPGRESNKEHLRGLLKSNLFPVPQPGIPFKISMTYQYILLLQLT